MLAIIRMPILSPPVDPALLHGAAGEPARLVVVALCAGWCNTCGEFRATLEQIAREQRTTTFVWLDIEDDAALCGDVDVEDFPTIAAFRGDQVLHYGTALPRRAVFTRLLEELAQRAEPMAGVPDAVAELCRTLLGAAPSPD